MQKKRGKGRKKREIFGNNDAKEERKVAKKREIFGDNDAKEGRKVAKKGNFWWRPNDFSIFYS